MELARNCQDASNFMKRKKFFDPYPPTCAGLALGEEESEACPLRDNCKRYKEGTVDPLIFYTFAFGCDDYDEIDPEWEEREEGKQ